MTKPQRPKKEREDEEANEAAEQILKFKLTREIQVGKGDKRRTLPDTHYLAVNLLTIDDKIAVRKATGLAFESFWGEDKMGEDSLVVLWWLARRKTSEPLLSFHQAKAEWPDDLDADEFDLDVGPADPEADDPEA